MSKGFEIVVAATEAEFGIGKEGGLPWRLPGDMKFFKELTTVTGSPSPISTQRLSLKGFFERSKCSHYGKKNLRKYPPKFRPLSGRINVILSRNEKLREDMDIPEEVLISSSLDAAMEELCQGVSSSRVAKIFVIGGGSIYEEAMKSPHCSIVHLTSVQGSFEGLDTFSQRCPHRPSC